MCSTNPDPGQFICKAASSLSLKWLGWGRGWVAWVEKGHLTLLHIIPHRAGRSIYPLYTNLPCAAHMSTTVHYLGSGETPHGSGTTATINQIAPIYNKRLNEILATITNLLTSCDNHNLMTSYRHSQSVNTCENIKIWWHPLQTITNLLIFQR